MVVIFKISSVKVIAGCLLQTSSQRVPGHPQSRQVPPWKHQTQPHPRPRPAETPDQLQSHHPRVWHPHSSGRGGGNQQLPERTTQISGKTLRKNIGITQHKLRNFPQSERRPQINKNNHQTSS